MADIQQANFSRGDVLARRYEIEKELGSGMLGVTYLVRHVTTGKQLALKVLRTKLVENPRDHEKFEATFNTVKNLRNEGVVAMGETGEHNGNLFYTMEYFPSQNLRELIDEYQRSQRSFTLHEAAQIVSKILEALTFLHEAGVYHRNLKPENVLVATRATGPGGKNVVRTIKISDAGLADIVNPTIFAESYISRTEARYLAPELSGFEHPGTPKADVYSTGVILYELLVGQTPRGTYLSPTALRGDLPEHIDDVVELALDPNADDRYPTAADMARDIQRSVTEENQDDKPKTSLKNIYAGVGVGIGILVCIGVYITFFYDQDAREAASASAKDERLRAQVGSQVKKLTKPEMDTLLTGHEEMLYIPPGPFIQGRLSQEAAASFSLSEPIAKVVEVKGFYIDRFEYPNRVKGDDGKKVQADVRTTWTTADAACQTLGKRLCTEEEWEKACKGPGNLIYAYGDAFNPEVCGKGLEAPYALGELSTCVTGYGVAGMSGGPREWTSSVAGTKGTRRIAKGGLRGNPQRGSRCAFAVDESAEYADGSLSFRCCLDVGATAIPQAPAAPAGEAPAGEAPAAPAEAPK